MSHSEPHWTIPWLAPEVARLAMSAGRWPVAFDAPGVRAPIVFDQAPPAPAPVPRERAWPDEDYRGWAGL